MPEDTLQFVMSPQSKAYHAGETQANACSNEVVSCKHQQISLLGSGLLVTCFWICVASCVSRSIICIDLICIACSVTLEMRASVQPVYLTYMHVMHAWQKLEPLTDFCSTTTSVGTLWTKTGAVRGWIHFCATTAPLYHHSPDLDYLDLMERCLQLD